MKSKTTTITHPSQLNALSAFTLLRKRGLGRIRISESFEHPEKADLEKALNSNYYACGCSTSAKFLMAGLILGLVLASADRFLYPGKLFNPYAGIVILTLGGAILGKGIGLLNANARLKRTVYTIQALWRPKDKYSHEQPVCG